MRKDWMETKAMTKFRGIKFLFIVTEWALIIPLDKSPSMCYSILVRSVCPYYALRKTAWTLSPMFVYEESYTFKMMHDDSKMRSIVCKVCLVIWKMFPYWNVIASSRFLSSYDFFISAVTPRQLFSYNGGIFSNGVAIAKDPLCMTVSV